MHLRLACRMNVKNETARILRAHAERAASANALGKNLFQTIYIHLQQMFFKSVCCTGLCAEITLFKSRSCERGFLIVGGIKQRTIDKN